MTEDALSDAQLQRFDQEGFLVLDGWLDHALASRLVDEVDQRTASTGCWPPYELPEHAMLTSHPPLMAVMEQLLGPDFLFHHVHGGRMDGGTVGIPWHNDYMQVPQGPRLYGNVVAFIYAKGLDGTVGNLCVVPGSHAMVTEWRALSLFGTEPLPGEVVIDRLGPASVVLAHTGLLHCRRPRPGMGRRYLSDVSYCQRGISWPAWFQGDWRAMHRSLRAQGCDRGGRYAHLYDDTQFFDTRAALERIEAERGEQERLAQERRGRARLQAQAAG